MKGIGEETHGVQMGRTAHAPFQIADSPQAHPRSLRQLLLGQRGGGSELSQEIGE
jgi:hypothetical protein